MDKVHPILECGARWYHPDHDQMSLANIIITGDHCELIKKQHPKAHKM